VANHYMNRIMVNRLRKAMKVKGVTTSQLCKALNIGYCDFIAMCNGKSPCYNKWQRKIAEVLDTDREVLFREFTDEKPKVVYVVTAREEGRSYTAGEEK